MSIYFHVEPPLNYTIKTTLQLKKWLQTIINQEGGFTLQNLTYILCTDDYLYNMNVQYLQHSTYTDVITFDNSDQQGNIEGDIFISMDRIQENATTFNCSPAEELRRVMAHGLLHLLGYKDKTPTEQTLMRQKENEALEIYKKLLKP